jgi:hypothetical protein
MIRLRFKWDEEAFIRANRINDLLRMKKGPYRHLKWLFLALFLILQYPIFYWVPRQAFAKSADVEWFRDQAQERAKDYVSSPW